MRGRIFDLIAVRYAAFAPRRGGPPRVVLTGIGRSRPGFSTVVEKPQLSLLPTACSLA